VTGVTTCETDGTKRLASLRAVLGPDVRAERSVRSLMATTIVLADGSVQHLFRNDPQQQRVNGRVRRPCRA
jgi:hypothetical protein